MPINAETENALYLRNGKAYKLQTWYTDGVRWSASPICALTTKVKDQGYNVTLSVWHRFAHYSTKKCHRSTKIGVKAVRAKADILHQFQGQTVKGQGQQTDTRYNWVALQVSTCWGGGMLWRPPVQLVLLLNIICKITPSLIAYRLIIHL